MFKISLFVALLIPSVAVASVRPIQNSGSVAASTATVILDYNGNATVPYGVVAASGSFSSGITASSVTATAIIASSFTASTDITLSGIFGQNRGNYTTAVDGSAIFVSSTDSGSWNFVGGPSAAVFNISANKNATSGLTTVNPPVLQFIGKRWNGSSNSNANGNIILVPSTAIDSSVVGIGFADNNNQMLTVSHGSKVSVTAGPFSAYQRTRAQLDAITPAAGDMYICSDCAVTYSICVASAATLSGFRRGDLSTAGCGTNN